MLMECLIILLTISPGPKLLDIMLCPLKVNGKLVMPIMVPNSTSLSVKLLHDKNS